MRIAHSIPMAGHLGTQKTLDRIQRSFYWPGMYSEVRNACMSCAECQKAGRKTQGRAPLMPLPVMSEPFERVAIDIVGPLPRTKSGNKYLLTPIDYGTRYPEAVPLRSTDAATVAAALLSIFTRMGVPREILSDQGSNFLSKLMEEMYKALGASHLKTSPYHPQTNGAVERFHGTLKSMLHKMRDDKRGWDVLLPSFLFAYREVPTVSTGFSPFDLMFGRHVRGPLDVLRESWVPEPCRQTTAIEWVEEMREQLRHMQELAGAKQQKQKDEMKDRFDRNATDRSFEDGDQVLVLMPEIASKLTSQWQGPYSIIEQVSPVTYAVDMPDHRKRRRVVHINMLKKWRSPVASVLAASVVHDDDDPVGGEIVTATADSKGTPTLGEELTTSQREQLEEIVEAYSDVFSDKPGKTDATQHCIDTEGATPFRIPPYRVAKAWEEDVRQEIRSMLELGVIEPCRSPWASPIVTVAKKDGTLRLCVDYRKLNSIMADDPYQMPRVEEMLDRLGPAEFISTIDLAKGYYQVPVREEDQDKTAFVSPFGKYRFTRMPFGLKGAPTTFQRLMDGILDGLQDHSSGYIDDIAIYSSDWESHCKHLAEVLGRLRAEGLTAKSKKCQLGMKTCVFLGHVVGKGQVAPEHAKVSAVRDFQRPQTKADVRAFLGLAGYYRRFIPEFSGTAAPLSDLTRATAPNKVVWTSTCEEAFQKLKTALTDGPILTSPDYSRQFLLQTDASERGVGAILSNWDEQGVDRPVAYYSRKLLPRESRYATIEKECLHWQLWPLSNILNHIYWAGLLSYKLTIVHCSICSP